MAPISFARSTTLDSTPLHSILRRAVADQAVTNTTTNSAALAHEHTVGLALAAVLYRELSLSVQHGSALSRLTPGPIRSFLHHRLHRSDHHSTGEKTEDDIDVVPARRDLDFGHLSTWYAVSRPSTVL